MLLTKVAHQSAIFLSLNITYFLQKTDLFEMFLERLTGTQKNSTNLRRRSDVPTGI